MNVIEHLLTILAEEGCEVGQASAKAQRFGLSEICVNVPDGPTNQERLIGELNDVIAVADLLVQVGALPADWQNAGMQRAKKERVVLWMGYSHGKGTLTKEGSPALPPAAV